MDDIALELVYQVVVTLWQNNVCGTNRMQGFGQQ